MGVAEINVPSQSSKSLTLCNCWAAREGSDRLGPYIYCFVRAMNQTQDHCRIRKSAELLKCPGADVLEAELTVSTG